MLSNQTTRCLSPGLFTRVRGSGIPRTSPVTNSAKFACPEFSEVRTAPVLHRAVFLRTGRGDVGSSDRGSTGLRPSDREEHNDAGSDRGEAAGSSGGAGSYAEGGGGACQRIPLDPLPPGVRQASSLHADRDEDRQGIRRARRGVGGGGVASRTIPTVALPARPSARTSPLRRSPKFAYIEFSEVD